MSTTAEEVKSTNRSEALRATRNSKLKELFEGKKFEILKEVHLEGDERFQTPFGNKGRHGFAVREVGNPENQFVVGEAMLRLAASEFGSVEVPEKPRKRRTKEQKAADDARLAEEKARKAAEKANA